MKDLIIKPEKFSIYWKQLIRELDNFGYGSLGIVALTSVFMGAVITIQTVYNLVNPLVPLSAVGIVARDSIILEFSPTMMSLVLAGKIGSSIGAELGSMKVTEQIDAMEVSGTNPFKYIVVTRILSTTLTIPILIIIGDAVALYGSYLAVNIRGSVSFTLFFKQVFDSLEFSDVVPAFVKTFFFGFAIGLIGCYKGYNSKKGTEGVGRSANSAVVIGSLLVFIIDLIAVQITEFFGFL